MSLRRKLTCAGAVAGALAAAGLAAAPAAQAMPAGPSAYLSHLSKLHTLTSTVPGNGDVNPYGIFVITSNAGKLHKGNVLVSNFNNLHNLQGTGSTIVSVTPSGHRTLFAKIDPKTLPGPCPGGVGLTTALEVLPGGWVVVGSTPSTNGMAATAKAGCLIVLNSNGQVAETISGHGINGPWDSAVAVRGRMADLFVANVLNGTVAANGKVVHRGTVLRLTLALSRHAPPAVMSVTQVGHGFAEQTNSAAFVLGPTGLGLGRGHTLFIAETDTNRILAISHALGRTNSILARIVAQGGKLSMPLGLAIAPNGDVLTVNGGNGRIVETTPMGSQIASRFLDTSGSPPGSGALFGLAVRPRPAGVYYVDDATNTLRLLH
jgi:hypothetical protein